MIRIYLAMLDIVPAAVILIPVFLILYGKQYQRNMQKSMFSFLFCLYLSAVFTLVGIPNILYFRPEINLNLIPLYGIVADLKNSILNVALFLPLGCFLPILWSCFRRPIPVVIFGFGLSLFIELLQMLTFRTTDVNDLITNVLGTAIGYFIMKPFSKGFPENGNDSREAYILTGLSFSIIFFLHPVLSPLIWDRIL